MWFIYFMYFECSQVDTPGQAEVLPTGEILFWKAVSQRRIYGDRKENYFTINFQCSTLE